MTWWTSFKKSRELLGMNARNLDYLRPYNRGTAKRLADNKILSKRLLRKHGLSVPKLIAKIRNVGELESFDWSILPSSFALKPNRGFGGEGIIVVYGKKKDRSDTWIKADGSLVTTDDLKTHIRNILDGSYSLANVPDIAFFEERIKLFKLFKPYTFKGIPDIRVIVFNHVPVMAMLRLPTKESQGKANLQQGAIGVGIDLALGITTSAIWHKQTYIDFVPGTRLSLSGIRIPFWQDILRMAVDAQKVSGLGFLGADIAIDRDHGPVLLELNARPGLSIQLANREGLAGRLRRVSGLTIKGTTRGVRVGMDLFGGEIKEEVEGISGKKIIGPIEKITLVGKEGKTAELEAKIDTGATFSAIDDDVAHQLGYGHVLAAFHAAELDYETAAQMTKEERQRRLGDIPDLAGTILAKASNGNTYRPMVRVTMLLGNVEMSAKVSIIDRTGLKYPAIIGRRNLGEFLIDVEK